MTLLWSEQGAPGWRRRQAGNNETQAGLSERAGNQDEPLFPTRTGRRLSSEAVQRLVHKHATAAAQQCPSIHPDQLHPHVLRHSCAMALLQAGVDTAVIALWLGHADILDQREDVEHYFDAVNRLYVEAASPSRTVDILREIIAEL